MLLRFDAINGGAKFSEIAEEVILLDIIEDPAEMNVQTSPLAGGPGMLVSSATRKSLTVRLVYVIREMDPVRRAELRDKVARWAYQASQLEISTRPGKQLSAKAYIPTAQGSALRWTDELTITFTAYQLPYWVDSQVTGEIHSTDEFGLIGAVAITPNGADVAIPVSCVVAPSEPGTLTDFEIGVGNTKIVLSGLEVINGMVEVDGFNEYREDSLYIESATGHDMRIRDNNGKSYLHTRTASSNDTLMAVQGIRNVIYAKANIKCDVYFYWSGWWL